MKNQNVWLYGAIIFTALFIASAVAFRIFEIDILPSQFYGALISVVITAIITVFLLRGQSEQEIKRDKNLKVFETQKEKYNNFIDEMWEIWEKRSVELEEVNKLLKMVSKDIVLYTKPDTVNNILSHLTEIAEYANKAETDCKGNFSKEMQKPFFNIIDCLAKEINLGGEINEDIRKKINALEDKLLPYINSKEYVKTLDKQVRDKIKGLQKFKYESDETSDEKKVCMWHIDKDMWLRVGDQWGDGVVYFSFWSEFYENRQYQDYRLKLRGDDKNWMRVYKRLSDFTEEEEDIIDFNDFRNGKSLPPNALENLANYISEFFKKEYKEFADKDIRKLIEECNN